MSYLLDRPLLFFAVCFLTQWFAMLAGRHLHNQKLDPDEQDDLGVILTANLTLLGLIIGFTFSMAISRYDQRKNYEEVEANAIGTEFVRASVLPPADAAVARGLLKEYLRQRILFYTIDDPAWLRRIDWDTARLQRDLWASVQKAATAEPTPVAALALQGMNDVLNSQGYTQASWWNRIPGAAWTLMIIIAMSSSIMVGYTARRPWSKVKWYFIFPLIISSSFLLIADIDSPRGGGFIHVGPQNLEALLPLLSAH
jgi:hypothetical protein